MSNCSAQFVGRMYHFSLKEVLEKWQKIEKKSLKYFVMPETKKATKDHWGHGKRTQKPAGQRYNSLSFSKLLIKKIITMS